MAEEEITVLKAMLQAERETNSELRTKIARMGKAVEDFASEYQGGVCGDLLDRMALAIRGALPTRVECLIYHDDCVGDFETQDRLIQLLGGTAGRPDGEENIVIHSFFAEGYGKRFETLYRPVDAIPAELQEPPDQSSQKD